MRSAWVKAIALKDIRAITANIQVWLPMLVVPLMLGVVLPAVLVGGLAHLPDSALGNTRQIEEWVGKLTLPALEGMNLRQKMAWAMANYSLAPFFLLIPLMVSSVITADGFAGEKERGTLESLLFTPVDLESLLLAKVLAAFVPSMALSWGTFLLTAISVNALGWPLFHRVFFPQWNWAPLMLLVIPAISLAAILVGVVVSLRVSTFQAAYQAGGLAVLPIVLLLVGQLSGVLLFGTGIVLAIGLVLVVLDYVGFRVLVRRLDRARLFETQVR